MIEWLYVLQDYYRFMEHIERLDLMEVNTLRPIIDGNHLCKELNLKPGPWMKGALDIVMAWQLRNPGKENDKRAAVEEVDSLRKRPKTSK